MICCNGLLILSFAFVLQGYTSATFTPDVGSTFAGVVATRLGLKPSAVAVVAVNGVFLDSPMYVIGRERRRGERGREHG